MKFAQTRGFYLGKWLVQPSLNQITDGETINRLAPKFMHVLVYLARQPGQVATRDELLDTVWAGTVVGEAVLTRAISELRKVFDDDPRSPQVIETILKTGYRLIASVSLVGADAPELTPTILPLAREKRLSGLRPRRLAWVAAVGALLLLAAWLNQTQPTPSLSSAQVKPTTQVKLTPLTSYPGEEVDPAFSPDGQRIAFVWRKDGDTRVPYREADTYDDL